MGDGGVEALREARRPCSIPGEEEEGARGAQDDAQRKRDRLAPDQVVRQRTDDELLLSGDGARRAAVDVVAAIGQAGPRVEAGGRSLVVQSGPKVGADFMDAREQVGHQPDPDGHAADDEDRVGEPAPARHARSFTHRTGPVDGPFGRP